MFRPTKVSRTLARRFYQCAFTKSRFSTGALPVEVHSRKDVDIGGVPTAEEYMNDLTRIASQAPGYLSAEHLWKYYEIGNDNINCQLLTISRWKSLLHWNNWLESPERQSIHNNKQFNIFNNMTHEVYFRKNDTPQLT